MVVFCSANLEVPGSIPAISKFFLKFPSLEVCGFKSPSRLHHFFSCVESNNLCFLLVFGLNTDLYLLTKVSDSLDVFKSFVEQCDLSTYGLEVIEDSQNPLNIKLVKVLTIRSDLSQKNL